MVWGISFFFIGHDDTEIRFSEDGFLRIERRIKLIYDVSEVKEDFVARIPMSI